MELATKLYLGNKELEKMIAERSKDVAERLYMGKPQKSITDSKQERDQKLYTQYYDEEILPVGHMDARGYMLLSM